MRAGRKYTLAAAILAVVAAAGLSHGRVYLRTGGGSGLESLVYSAAVTINGGKGDLRVFKTVESFDEAVDRLRETEFAENPDALAAGDGMAFGMRTGDGKVARILVASTGTGCAIFRIEQTDSEYGLAKKGPPADRQDRIPVFPGSTRVFSMDNHDTRTAIEVSSSAASPEAIGAALREQLERDGWKNAVFPRGAGPGAPGMPVYMKDRNICCFVVAQAEGEQVSMITVLHKEMNKAERNE